MDWMMIVGCGAVFALVFRQMALFMFDAITEEAHTQIGGHDDHNEIREAVRSIPVLDPYRTAGKNVESKPVKTLQQRALLSLSAHNERAVAYALLDIADALRDVAAAIKTKGE
jgi:hypothetical protein